jgi:integrase
METTTTAIAETREGESLIPATLVASARGYASQAKAQRTRDLYRGAFQAFASWAQQQNVEALPAKPDTVALYLTALAQEGRKVASITLALAGIAQAHKAAGLDSPRSTAVVREVMAGIRRALGVAQRQAAPVLVADLRAIVQALPDNRLGARDRALLLLGFAGAFRRSELVSLDVDAIAFTADGLEVTLKRSKTDQEGAGRKIGVRFASTPETCPVRSLRAWLDGAGIVSGPVFREVTRHGHVSEARLSDRTVARVVKRSAERAGLDASRLPVTPSARASQRPPQRPASPSGRSWRRPATAPSRWCAATSETPPCSPTTRPRACSDRDGRPLPRHLCNTRAYRKAPPLSRGLTWNSSSIDSSSSPPLSPPCSMRSTGSWPASPPWPAPIAALHP